MSYFSVLAPVYLETAPDVSENELANDDLLSKLSTFQDVVDASSPHSYDRHTDIFLSYLGVELQIRQINETEQMGSTSSRHRKPAQVDPLSCVAPHFDRNYFDFPFFTDQETVKYLRDPHTKVMFIMRGLSGSGKSSIVQILKSSYKNIAVCSADDYFRSADGTYNFDEKLLSSAHGDCQHRAKQACKDKISVVVIDNTNVKKWEMKFYMDLAKTSGYVVVTVQPKTPWKWNPEELASKNKHGVEIEILQKKVSAFDDIIPAYYGWFPTEWKSECLTALCSNLFTECLSKFPGLKKDLLWELKIKVEHIDEETAKGILLEYYSKDSDKSPLLHCTGKFCRWGKAEGSTRYHQRSDVQRACGQMFSLCVTGLVITKKTMGVRVTLDSTALSLFDRPEEREWGAQKVSGKGKVNNGARGSPAFDLTRGKQGGKKGKRNSPKQRKAKRKSEKDTAELENSLADLSLNDDENDESVQSLSESGENCFMGEAGAFDSGSYQALSSQDTLHENMADTTGNDGNACCSSTKNVSAQDDVVFLSEKFPSLNYKDVARSAHFTVKTARGVKSVEVNFDILHACDVEAQHTYHTADFVPVQRGQACYYGDGLCCVYFDKPLSVKTLFSTCF